MADFDAFCDPYICPTTGETECLCHGGFDDCCDHPRCPGNRDKDALDLATRGRADATAHLARIRAEIQPTRVFETSPEETP